MSESVFDRCDGLALADLIRKKEVSPTELLDEAISRVEGASAKLNCLAERDYDFARGLIEKGLPDGPFTGVPFLRKDECCDIEGLKTTSGVRLLRDNVTGTTRTIAQRYLNAGLVIFGSTTVPPFCTSFDTDRSSYGATRNPWDPTRVPGGSSSGSGALVGCGALPMAHGNDGGGSLRIPAAWSGAFTVKPSRGRISNGPVFTEDWLGFGVEGTITRSVRDCAAMLDATMGPETGSRYVAPVPKRSYLEETQRPCRPLRIAMLEQTHDGQAFHPDCLAAVRDVAALLDSLGHKVEVGTLSFDVGAVSKELYKTVAVAVCNALDDIGEARGRVVEDGELEILMRSWRKHGRTVTGAEYARINDYSMKLAHLVDTYMEQYDLILSPTLPLPAPKIGEIYKHEDDLEAFRADQDRYISMTMTANLTGQPAMSVPLCWSPDNMPIGMMFTARYGDESSLFALASQLEGARPWWNKRPSAA